MNNIEVLIEKYIGSKEIYRVPMHNTKKYLETTVPPEERELDNLPKYTNGNNKVRFQDGLELEKSPELWPKYRNTNGGWAKNGCCYSGSHRAIGKFYKGKKVRRDEIGNDTGKEFIIDSHEKAEEMAKKFAKEVS